MVMISLLMTSEYQQQDRAMADSPLSKIGGDEQQNVAERIKRKLWL